MIGFLLDAVDDDLRRRFDRVMLTRAYDPDDVTAGRAYVRAFLDFVVFSHHLYLSVTGARRHEVASGEGPGRRG